MSVLKSLPSFDTLVDAKELKPEIWGPTLWVSLHSIPFITKKYDANHVAFYRSLTKVLVCKACQMPYQMFLDKHSPNAITRRKELFIWTNELHNYVNTHLKKKTWTPMESYKAFKPIAKKIWSVALRQFLICIFRTYDNSKRGSVIAFLESLYKIIPPSTLRTQIEHFVKNFPHDEEEVMERGVTFALKQ